MRVSPTVGYLYFAAAVLLCVTALAIVPLVMCARHYAETRRHTYVALGSAVQLPLAPPVSVTQATAKQPAADSPVLALGAATSHVVRIDMVD
jgi:hypothetical protein